MLSVNTCQAEQVNVYGREFASLHYDQFQSFEQAAQASAQRMYETFREPEGTTTFALVRVFLYLPVNDLHPELYPLVSEDDSYVLALMGTYGDEPAWCNRRHSRSHQVVSPRNASPMFRASFQQLGLDWGAHVNGERPETLEQVSMTRCFYVQDAFGSALIPDQETFVEPYGIWSVLGVGCSYGPQCGCLTLAFSRAQISQNGAQNFGVFAPHLFTSLALYRENLWG